MFTFRSYLLELLLWVLIPAGIGFALFHFAIPQYTFESYPVIPAAIILLGLLFFPFLKKASKATTEVKKSRAYMTNTLIKMFLSITIVALFAIFDRPNAAAFAATYFVFYLLLISFETRYYNKVVSKK